MEIILTENELFQAAIIGIQRRLESLRNHRVGKAGQPTDQLWRDNIEGACGEAAVSKALNTFWLGEWDVFKTRKDVAKKYEVRTSAYASAHLILFPDDFDDTPYILVTGSAPNYKMAGWLLGSDGKKNQYWGTRAGRSSYWIPQTNLHSMKDLLDAA